MQKIDKKEGAKKPFDALMPLRVEIDRISSGLSVLVYGVKSIKDFSSELAVFRLGGASVRVSGKGLSITVYEGRAVEIRGKVSGVEFI